MSDAEKALQIFDLECLAFNPEVSPHERRVKAMAKALAACPEESPTVGEPDDGQPTPAPLLVQREATMASELDPKGLVRAHIAFHEGEKLSDQIPAAIRAYLTAAPSPSPAPGVVAALPENVLEDAAKAAFIKAQSVYRGLHDHLPLKNTWETLTESIRDGWRAIAHAALEAAYMPPLGTQPEPRLPRDVPSTLASLSQPANPEQGVSEELSAICAEVGCQEKPGVALRFVKELRRDLSRAHERQVELLRTWEDASLTERQELDRLRRGWGPSTPTERMARRTDLRAAMTVIERAMDAVLPDDKEDDDLTRDHFQAAYDKLTEGYREIIALIQAIPELNAPDTAALAAAPAGGEWQPTHRHVKTGREYRLDGYAEIQTNDPLIDYDKVAIYRDQSGKTWVRPVGEFNDERFEALPASPAKEGRS